jgi:hypothetical protein
MKAEGAYERPDQTDQPWIRRQRLEGLVSVKSIELGHSFVCGEVARKVAFLPNDRPLIFEHTASCSDELAAVIVCQEPIYMEVANRLPLGGTTDVTVCRL